MTEIVKSLGFDGVMKVCITKKEIVSVRKLILNLIFKIIHNININKITNNIRI